MPRPKKTPKYCLHKASGQAVVRINGSDIYLGKHGTPESHAKYLRVLGEHQVLEGERGGPDVSDAAARPTGGVVDLPSLSEVLLRYWSFAKGYYVKNGEPTSELEAVRSTIELLDKQYGLTRADQFGPLALKAIREQMIDRSLVRTSINRRIDRIKRIFKWAVTEQLVPASVHQALTTVAGLRFERSRAAESEPVEPAEIVQSGEVWIYSPAYHKNRHRGHTREIHLGPRAQAVLKPYWTASNGVLFLARRG